MKIKNNILLMASVLVLIFVPGVPAQNRTIVLTTKDKREIIKRVLDDGVGKLMANERFSECKSSKTGGKKIILVRTKESNLFPTGVKGYRFRFLSEDGMEAEIKKNNGACFFEVEDLKIMESNTVQITMWRWKQTSSTSSRGSVGGEGLIYKAVKTKGKWVVQFSEATSVWS